MALRVLAALLAVVLMAGPAAATFADPAPKPFTHVDHLESPESEGCLPFHDDAFCLSCRLLSSHPLRSHVDPVIPTLLTESTATLRGLASSLPDDHVPSPLRARAPPRI